MSLSHKWVVVLLCTIAFNFLIVLKTAHVSAQVETDQSPCPSTLLWAVLKGDTGMARFLLERGADPNASLENCQDLGFEEFRFVGKKSSLLGLVRGVIIFDEDQMDRWRKSNAKSWSSSEPYPNLHLNTRSMYSLLVLYGANEGEKSIDQILWERKNIGRFPF